MDAGDLSCTVLIIFNGPGSCGAGPGAALGVTQENITAQPALTDDYFTMLAMLRRE